MLTGFILAAGFGTRLKPLTDHIPKALVPVCGEPLLRRALCGCRQAGMERIGVNSFHFSEQMRAFREQSEIPFELFEETGTIRGTGGALHFARDFLSAGEDFFTCNVDILAEINLNVLHERFLAEDCTAGLVALAVPGKGSIYYDRRTKDYGGAQTDPGAAGDCAEFLGMVFYKKDFLSLVRPDDFSILPVWKRAQEMGRRVKVIETQAAYWKDAGTIGSLARIHFDVLERRCSLSVPDAMTIDFARAVAFPSNYSPRDAARLGSRVWCEAASLPDEVFIENSIVLKDAVLPPCRFLRNTILTRWGELHF